MLPRNSLMFLTIFLVTSLMALPVKAEIDGSIFKIHAQDPVKDKFRQSKYYKELASLVKSGQIVTLHQKLHKEVYGARPVEMMKLMETSIFLEDETIDLRSRPIVHAYLLDLHATALHLMSGFQKQFKTETEEQKKYLEKESDRYAKASLIRILQWKILAEEDAYRCKHYKEALEFLSANVKKYRPDQKFIVSVDKDKLSKAALDISEKLKDRPNNELICKMSQQYKTRLRETGTPTYATEQEDGTVLIHMETAETPVNKKSQNLGMYLNTGQIKPDYVTEKEWLAKRKKIRDNFIKTPLNSLVLD